MASAICSMSMRDLRISDGDLLLEWMKPFDSESLYNFYLRADDICESMGMEFGPACLHCQNNTLALPRELKSMCFANVYKNGGEAKQ